MTKSLSSKTLLDMMKEFARIENAAMRRNLDGLPPKNKGKASVPVRKQKTLAEKRREKMIEVVKRYPGLNRIKYSEMLGISPRRWAEAVTELVETGKLIRKQEGFNVVTFWPGDSV